MASSFNTLQLWPSTRKRGGSLQTRWWSASGCSACNPNNHRPHGFFAHLTLLNFLAPNSQTTPSLHVLPEKVSTQGSLGFRHSWPPPGSPRVSLPYGRPNQTLLQQAPNSRHHQLPGTSFIGRGHSHRFSRALSIPANAHTFPTHKTTNVTPSPMAIQFSTTYNTRDGVPHLPWSTYTLLINTHTQTKCNS